MTQQVYLYWHRQEPEPVLTKTWPWRLTQQDLPSPKMGTTQMSIK